MGVKQKAVILAGNAMTKVKASSPEIKLIVGVAAIIGGSVLLCRGARKSSEVVEEVKSQLDELHEVRDSLDRKEYAKQVLEVYKRGGWIAARFYGPGMLVQATGIFLAINGHGELHKRYVSAMALAEAWAASFSQYRENVRNELGAEQDQMFLDGIHMEKMKEGNKNVQVPVINKNDGSDPVNYEMSFYLDKRSWPNWIDGGNVDLMVMQVKNAIKDEALFKGIYRFRLVCDILNKLDYRLHEPEYFDQRAMTYGWLKEDIVLRDEVPEGCPYNVDVAPFRAFDRDTGEWYDAIKLTMKPDGPILEDIGGLKLPKLSGPVKLPFKKG